MIITMLMITNDFFISILSFLVVHKASVLNFVKNAVKTLSIDGAIK